MSRWLLGLALVALALTPSLAADLPGFRLHIQSGAVNRMLKYFRPLIVADIRKLVIPGESGHDFRFWDIHIGSADLSSLTLTTVAPHSLHAGINNFGISLASTEFEIWKRIIVKIHCHGQFWGSVEGTTIDIDFPIDDKDGSGYVPAVTPVVHFGKVSFGHKFHHFLCKAADKIVSLFVNINKKVEELIEKEIPELIQKKLRGVLNEGLHYLTREKIIDKWAIADYELTEAPVANAAGLTASLKGEFLLRSDPKKKWPIQPAPMPAPIDEDLVLTLGDYVLNTALLTYSDAGRLDVHNKTLNVTTKIFEHILPSVYKKCKDCPINLSAGVTTAPVVTFAEKKSTFHAKNLFIDVGVVMNGTGPDGDAEKKVWKLFDLNADIEGSMNFTVNASGTAKGVLLISADVNLEQLNLTVLHSNIGPLPIHIIGDAVKFILEEFLKILDNNILHNVPIPFPFKYFELTKIITQVVPGNLVIGGDFEFKPSSELNDRLNQANEANSRILGGEL